MKKKILRLFGNYWEREGHESAVYSWGEISWDKASGGLGIYMTCWDSAQKVLVIKPLFISIFIHFSNVGENKMTPWELDEQKGINFTHDGLDIKWGKSFKIYYRWPWVLDFYKKWDYIEYKPFFGKEEKRGFWIEIPRMYHGPDFATTETFEYTYTLKSRIPTKRHGPIQKVNATISRHKMEWRWKSLMWLPYPRYVREYIDVKFSDEIGEESGSWKGGTVGCSYDMLPGETPKQTLTRMQNERKF